MNNTYMYFTVKKCVKNKNPQGGMIMRVQKKSHPQSTTTTY